MTNTPVLLQFNCGYARSAVKEITSELAAGKLGKAARDVNCKLRVEKFQSLFNITSFGIPKGFYEAATAKRPPVFEARCESILDAFSANWNSNCKRQEYLMTFTQRNWRKLPAAEKAKHSLQNCIACATQHTALQESFPGPTFKPDLASLYNSASTSRKDERSMARHALQFVNIYHEVSTFIRLWAKTVHT